MSKPVDLDALRERMATEGDLLGRLRARAAEYKEHDLHVTGDLLGEAADELALLRAEVAELREQADDLQTEQQQVRDENVLLRRVAEATETYTKSAYYTEYPELNEALAAWRGESK